MRRNQSAIPLATAHLGKRERQIMDVIYRRGRATAAEVLADLPDPPSYSAVRAMLKYLEDKGHLRHEQDGPRHVFLPTSPQGEVRAGALAHLVRTFFDGSISTTVAALIESQPLSRDEVQRLSKLLKTARTAAAPTDAEETDDESRR